MSSFRQYWKNVHLLRKVVYFFVGLFTYPGIALINRLRITGTEHFKKLPPENVLFVSNHQTYFADVITFLHIFCAVKWGKKNRLGFPLYLLNPYTRVNYVAAESTMKGSLLSRFFLLAGGITVKRTWSQAGSEIRKGLDPSDTRKILRALEQNRVITFPQGTTTPYAAGRKGTALIIKMAKPIVVPVVIDGFRTAFTKKGLWFRKKGTRLTVKFKEQLAIDYGAPAEKIMEQIMDAIEQSKQYKISASGIAT